MNDRNAPPPPWVNAFDAKDDATGLIVRVQKKGDQRPRYSIMIGKKRDNIEEDRLGSYLAVFVNGYGQGRIDVDRAMGNVLPGLLQQAYDFIAADAQNHENANTDRRISYEDRGNGGGGGGGNGHRHTGKTERGREKHRRRDRDEG